MSLDDEDVLRHQRAAQYPGAVSCTPANKRPDYDTTLARIAGGISAMLCLHGDLDPSKVGPITELAMGHAQAIVARCREIAKENRDAD